MELQSKHKRYRITLDIDVPDLITPESTQMVNCKATDIVRYTIEKALNMKLCTVVNYNDQIWNEKLPHLLKTRERGIR